MRIVTFALGIGIGMAVGKWGCASSAETDRARDARDGKHTIEKIQRKAIRVRDDIQGALQDDAGGRRRAALDVLRRDAGRIRAAGFGRDVISLRPGEVIDPETGEVFIAMQPKASRGPGTLIPCPAEASCDG